ncbi:MAG: flagella synthesis protein FlgN [Saccharospirillum sp.]
MITTAPVNELQAHLQAAIDASTAFSPVLHDEYDCLTRGEAEQLMQITQAKQAATDRLLTAASALLEHLKSLGLEPDTPSVERWAMQWPGSEAQSLVETWRQLRRSLDENDRLHETNRQLLADLSHRKAMQLNLLKNLLGQTDTYSSAGHYRTQSPSGWVDQV